MKQVKYITIAALITLTAFCTVLYTSCKKKDPCEGISCLNGGKCNSGKCVCPSGYEGTYCETTIDPCKGITCQNGGTCAGGTCSCPTGYEGTLCETMSRDKFVGTYVGSEACIVGSDAYSIALVAGSGGTQLVLSNLYNEALSATCTMAAADSFVFVGSQSGVSYSGTGRLVATTIKIRYSISSGAGGNSCVFTGTR